MVRVCSSIYPVCVCVCVCVCWGAGRSFSPKFPSLHIVYMYPLPEPPESPEISFDTTTNVFCFGFGGYHVEYYLVSVVDITGSSTLLSGIYSSPQCIKLTSDLYIDACGPFKIFVTAINQIGKSSHTFNTTGNIIISSFTITIINGIVHT